MDRQKAQGYHFLSSVYLPPAIMFAVGCLNVLFAEKLPANDGLGWDGSRYAAMAKDLMNSPVVDKYYITRIFPSFLVHFFFDLFNIPFTNKNIIRGFESINVISLTAAVFVTGKIFRHLNISPRKQWFGFALFFASYSILVYSFYYPVMTDPMALCLSVLLLYFYLKREPLNIILVSIIAAFTFPVVFYQGLLLFVFPQPQNSGYIHLPSAKRVFFSLLSTLYILIVIYYYVIHKKADSEFAYTLKISRTLLPLSILYVAAIYYFFPRSLFNKIYFSLDYIKKFDWNRMAVAGLLILLVGAIKMEAHPDLAPSPHYSADNFLRVFLVEGLTRPFITIVSHFNYFGSIIILLIIFWNKFSAEISKRGLGLPLAFLLQVYLVGIGSESRVITTIFPWMVIFLVVALKDYEFSNLFYLVILLINLLLSKIWLPINYDNSCGVDENGIVAFPCQKFFMNMGPWMSEKMWILLLIGFTISFLLIFFTLFSIRMRKGLTIIPKYKNID